MPLDPNIPLSVQSLDTATPLLQASQLSRQKRLDEEKTARQARVDELASERQKQQTSLTDVNIDTARLKNLEERDQQRLSSSIIASSRLNPLLESGNVEAARSFLNNRRRQLQQRAAEGENVDTVETDEALQMLDTDLQGLKDITSSATQAGIQLGILKSQSDAAGVGGATGELIDRLVKEGSANTVQEGLSLIKGFASKGFTFDEGGNAVPIKGFEKATESIEGAKETGKLKAKLKIEPTVAEAVEAAKIVGKEQGITQSELDAKLAAFPTLEKIVIRLSEIGKLATFTEAGKKADSVRRQLGLPVGEGAINRAKYISTVNNEILPLLKTTFGAAFTNEERKSLVDTLGSPDSSPAEKDAILSSFIAAKIGNLETLQRRTGDTTNINAASAATTAGDKVGRIEFLGFE